MKLKKGDEVIVIAGKDKGASGKVISVDRVRGRVVVEGCNLVKKNTKADAQGKGGGVVTMEAALHVSNVQLSEGGKPTRAGYLIKEDGKKVRVSRRTGKEI
jgi:large subunit ribosomal protein L24